MWNMCSITFPKVFQKGMCFSYERKYFSLGNNGNARSAKTYNN